MLNIHKLLVLFVASHCLQHCLAAVKHQLWGVRIFTGDKEGAGTDNPVYIQLHTRSKGLTEEKELIHLARKNFQRNQIDYFYSYFRYTDHLVAVDVKVGQKKDPWLLKRVELEKLDNQTTVIGNFGIETIGLSPERKRVFFAFDARSWWFKYPGEDHPLYYPQYTNDRSFLLRVVTSDMKDAGTTHLVCVQFYNDDLGVNSTVFEIQQPSGSGRTVLQRGTTDTFQFKTKHVGKPTGVKVWFKHLNEYFPDKLYRLDRIELEDILSDGKRLIYTFNSLDWMTAKLNQTYRIPLRKIHRVKTYRITTYTATDRWAATNVEVFIKLEGRKPNEETDYHRLDVPSKDDFKRGATDSFVITTKDVGLLYAVKLKIGKGDGWHLLKMDIEEPLQTGWTKTYEWPHTCWVTYGLGQHRSVNYLLDDPPHN